MYKEYYLTGFNHKKSITQAGSPVLGVVMLHGGRNGEPPNAGHIEILLSASIALMLFVACATIVRAVIFQQKRLNQNTS